MNPTNETDQQAQLPPGPKGRPLRGNLPEMRKERLQFLMQLREEYGDVV